MNNLSVFAVNRHAFAYFALMEKLQAFPRKKLRKSDPNYVYYESHHVLPKAIFPEFKSFELHPWNKVLLTPREHFVAHKLLARAMLCSEHRKKMNAPIKYMKLPPGIKGSKIYELEKQRIRREGITDEAREKLRIAGLGKKLSKESIAKRTATCRENGRQPHTAIARAAQSAAAKRRGATHVLPYRLKDPDGNIHEGTNRRELCRTFKLTPSHINGVVKGNLIQHKGWTLA